MLFKKSEVQQVANAMMNMLHEEEIDIVNDFHDAVVAKDTAKIDDLFKVLLYDIEDHFSTEEDMMEESQFYAFAIHKTEHDSMRKKVKAIKDGWDADKDPKTVQNFLEGDFKSWLVLHVARWDSETAMHLGDSM